MLRSLSITVALLLLAGCSLSGANEPESRRVINVAASHVEVLDASRQTVAFEFEGGVTGPCYEFEEAVVNREGQTVGVKVRARSTADYCVTGPASARLDVSPLEIEIGGEGTYTFVFWRGGQEPLKIEVSVP
jgi:hypothetical protein